MKFPVPAGNGGGVLFFFYFYGGVGVKKRFISLLLVTALCFVMAVPVFASDSPLAPMENAVVCPYCGEKFLTHYVDIKFGGVSHEEWKCWNCGNYYEKDSLGNFVLSEKGTGSLLQFVDKGISATMQQTGNTVTSAVTSDGYLIPYPSCGTYTPRVATDSITRWSCNPFNYSMYSNSDGGSYGGLLFYLCFDFPASGDYYLDCSNLQQYQ